MVPLEWITPSLGFRFGCRGYMRKPWKTHAGPHRRALVIRARFIRFSSRRGENCVFNPYRSGIRPRNKAQFVDYLFFLGGWFVWWYDCCIFRMLKHDRAGPSAAVCYAVTMCARLATSSSSSSLQSPGLDSANQPAVFKVNMSGLAWPASCVMPTIIYWYFSNSSNKKTTDLLFHLHA